MMVGEGTVDIAVQRDDFGADGFQQLWCKRTGNAVAGIGHDLQRAVQLHVVGDALDVVGTDIALLVIARLGRLRQAPLDDALVEIGDGIA